MSLPKISHVAQTLRAAGYPESEMTRLLTIMGKAGHLDLENGTTPKDTLNAAAAAADDGFKRVSETGYVRVQTLSDVAQDANKAALVRSVLRQAAALKVDFDPSQRINSVDLDRQLAGQDVPRRLAFKHSLNLLGLIP
jgi:hypothetical protein